jgi:hypothetical protein
VTLKVLGYRLDILEMSLSDIINDSSTTHEVACEKPRIRKVWKALEVARMELGLLGDLVKKNMTVPQVDSMIQKLGRARKSTKESMWDNVIAADLMES